VSRARAAAGLLATAALAGCGGAGAPARPPLLQVEVAQGPRAQDVATAFGLGDGRVATVAHVLDGRGVGATVLLVRDGRSTPVPARVLAVDERDDLALLTAPGVRARRPRSVDASTGAAVVLVLRAGRVRALPARVLRAVVAQIRTPDGRSVVRRPALELRVDVLPGDSGAPVVTRDGRLAGILFARSDSEPGVAFAVDASALSRLAPS